MRPGPPIALMYHRVCGRAAANLPYFVRGTAIRPTVFAAQLDWLRLHCDVMSASAWLKQRQRPWSPAGRPQVLLTVDDAHRDCVRRIAPACAGRGLPWVVFPIAHHTGDDPQPPWTDAYYALLANRPRSAHRPLRWWVRGPFRRWLDRLPAASRTRTLRRLAARWAVSWPLPALGPKLYATRSELQSLQARWVGVGGHGGDHRALDALTPEALQTEVEDSTALLDSLGIRGPRLFCYPNGRHDAPARAAVARAGYAAAFGVAPGVADTAADPFALPRYLVRDHAPTDTRWCAAFSTWSDL